MNILKVNHLSKHYTVNRGLLRRSLVVRAVNDITFSLQAGKTLAVVGETGSGKSTLARQIIGLENMTKGDIVLNEVKLNFTNNDHRKMRLNKIRMIFQNPFDALNPKLRIGKSLEDTLIINTTLDAKHRKEKIIQTLETVGLRSEHRKYYPHMFTSGQRQRIAIARAIILEPQIIIADEPLSALDVSIQAQILNLLQELQEKMGISYIFISHDLNVIEHIADHVLVMYRGQMVEYGSVSQVFDDPKHPYTQTLFASTPMYQKRFSSIKPSLGKKNTVYREDCCNFSARCYKKDDSCNMTCPSITTEKDGHQYRCIKSD
ncbi:MAG: ATP-binding cassette domain-containing protein [Gammaproteobacteria bacterium]|nr:ATP-binding cassette domain-containing protein [Gammaproteobacteria bacterium]MDH5629657.1 ATP-binding cassette domain-containing protein [Gammaproteobacteria bacterium]